MFKRRTSWKKDSCLFKIHAKKDKYVSQGNTPLKYVHLLIEDEHRMW